MNIKKILGCSSNRLFNRMNNRLHRVNKHPTGCHPVGCLFTRCNRLSNRLYSRLYRVNGELVISFAVRVHGPVGYIVTNETVMLNLDFEGMVNPGRQKPIFQLPYVTELNWTGCLSSQQAHFSSCDVNEPSTVRRLTRDCCTMAELLYSETGEVLLFLDKE